MDVEIPADVRDTAARLGAGVSYALKVMAGQLADYPDMGQPSNLPGILSVTIDGDLFEDCPALTIGYIREPDRIAIRYIRLSHPTGSASSARDQDPVATPATHVLAEREIADAWQRITHWLQHNTVDSYSALRPGASTAAIDALEHDLGIEAPASLRTLWSLTAGDDGVDGMGCLPGNHVLMTLDAVAALYRQQMESQAHQDTLNAGRGEYDRITVWKAAWIPVAALGPADRTSGLYLDSSTGYLGRWSRYNEGPDDELDTLVSYLEDVADMLEFPDLATRDKPGRVGEALVWGSRLDAAQEDQWQPLAGS
ncbi:hypothetical protein ABZV34_33830 [Streptomyces sp. NPDC005195]|uniref:hypothetical protein n=1 Tax=Streptomyces sp. NPDC005195 TaxID=3154561 RepID=UPI00339E4027